MRVPPALPLPAPIAQVCVESRALLRPHASPSIQQRAEYRVGRYCAGRALGDLHPALAGVRVPRAPGGAPVWPPSVVGSITHCDGFAAAAVTTTHQLQAIGIDAEPLRSAARADALAEHVATEIEVEVAMRACGLGRADAITLIASAKESVFKALHPLVDRWFDFDAVELLDWNTRTFAGRLTARLSERWPAGASLAGVFALARHRVHTACLVSA